MNSQRAMAVTMSLKNAGDDGSSSDSPTAPLVTQPGLLRRTKVWALKPSSWSPEKVRQNYVDSALAPPV